VPWQGILEALHVLAAITAVGANLTYAVWNLRGDAQREHLGFVLRGIKFIDDRIANPAYGVLLVTGLLQAFLYYSITDKFALIGLALFVVVAVVAAAGYSPLLNRQIALLDSKGADDAEYKSVANRAAGLGMFMGVLVVAIVFIMVFEPI